MGRGQWEEAVSDFSKAIELDPKYARAWQQRGYAHNQLQRWKNAISDFSKGIDLDPKNAWARVSRGNAYARLQQWENAIGDFSKAMDLDPKYAAAPNGLAWLLATCPDQKIRNAARAVAPARKAVELAPQAANYWNTLARPNTGPATSNPPSRL